MNTQNVEQLLKHAKAEYLGLQPGADVVKHGWAALRAEIDAREKRSIWHIRVIRYAVVFACIVLVTLAGTGGVAVASWRAQPGDFLYPMKTFSEQVLLAVRERQEERSEETHEVTGTPTATPEEGETDHPQNLPVGEDNVVRTTVKEAQEDRDDDEKKGIGQQVKGAATAVVDAVKEMVEKIHQDD
jgi:hypothetical protein